ncbi:MAG TPA: hypothetical protein DCS83_07000 [Prevotella sp.]|nr:hypothetical protein [Prevotella sp.]
MSKFYLYIPVQPFIKQWLVNHYGSEPIFFDPKSIENAVIKTFTIKRPKNLDVEKQKSDEVSICIPDNSYKDPLVYNYMGPKGKKAVRECLDDIFKQNMWSELYSLINEGDEMRHGCSVMSAIDGWCEAHGISIEYDTTIRQRFYRLRDQHKRHGINLKKPDKTYD